MNELIHGDCLEVMPTLEDNSVDMVLCDLPYGVTQNEKDNRINLEKLWIQYKRLIKSSGNIVLTSQFPFTLELIQSNQDWFRYDLIWDKVLISGFLNANRQPLRRHEHILIFYESLGVYNPQKTIGNKSHSRGTKLQVDRRNYGKHTEVDNSERNGRFKHPTSIIRFQKPHSSVARHPTEKPLKLFEYLIKTYSDKGDLVLDNCIGSGTTAEACIRTQRNFIGIELNEEYYKIALDRVNKTPRNLKSIISKSLRL